MRMVGCALIACQSFQTASGEGTSKGLAIKLVAEVEVRSSHEGQESVRLVPADRLVPGDPVIYTLQIRNVSTLAIPAPTVTTPIPAHTAYVAESATGPGAEVSYSVDGGHSFDVPENLRVSEAGHVRPAAPEDYTHIRWKMKNTLQPRSTAFARFRAIVK